MLTAAAVAALVAAPGARADRRPVAPPGVGVVGPYSPGVLAGDFLHVSGQGGRDAAGRRPATFEGEVRQALQHLTAVVAAAGLTREHVVYSQVYLTDMAQHDAMDRVWREFFPTAPPARAVVGVYGVPDDGAVQIDAVAYRPRAVGPSFRQGRRRRCRGRQP